jgi:hypothetical protein
VEERRNPHMCGHLGAVLVDPGPCWANVGAVLGLVEVQLCGSVSDLIAVSSPLALGFQAESFCGGLRGPKTCFSEIHYNLVNYEGYGMVEKVCLPPPYLGSTHQSLRQVLSAIRGKLLSELMDFNEFANAVSFVQSLQYRCTWVYGDASPYAQVLGHEGMHPGMWGCILIYPSAWVYGDA